MFSKKDLQQIQSKGINIELINLQIDHFNRGFHPTKLVDAARIGNGIIRFSEQKLQKLEYEFTDLCKGKKVLKFVPASGAASRMFKHLFEFMANYSPGKKEQLQNKPEFKDAFAFFDHIKEFAFYDDLNEVLKKDHTSIEELMVQEDYNRIISALLEPHGLNYANLPKGLIKFHKYPDKNRQSIKEHLVEGSIYCRDEQEDVRIHFTVSPEHMVSFKEAIRDTISDFEEKYNVSLKICFSIQKPSTDIIAVDLQNQPFRDEEGHLVFRPGGHGALIQNLNDLEADIIFIKNIDNVVPDRLKPDTYTYKKVIGSLLINLQNQTFEYLRAIKNKLNDDLIDEISTFAKERLNIHLPTHFSSREEHIDFLKKNLNRPIRVCGMVKNEGEPGGGPYWTENGNGEISLQIVESSQMDLNIPDQREIVSRASHFNPVDLVCGVFDYEGNKFDLTKYVDINTGFISQKSQNGKNLKAQELPGLWNGAMADWITIFVECPIITFNPVKTVNDLLRNQHQ